MESWRGRTSPFMLGPTSYFWFYSFLFSEDRHVRVPAVAEETSLAFSSSMQRSVGWQLHAQQWVCREHNLRVNHPNQDADRTSVRWADTEAALGKVWCFFPVFIGIFLKTTEQLHSFLPPYAVKASNWLESQDLSSSPRLCFKCSYKYKTCKTSPRMCAQGRGCCPAGTSPAGANLYL